MRKALCFINKTFSPQTSGIVGWGIAWYVNELLIPEITVQRGTTYTFQIYGGNDPQLSAQYHPFYISDDSEGGYAQKTANEQNVRRETLLYHQCKAILSHKPFFNLRQTIGHNYFGKLRNFLCHCTISTEHDCTCNLDTFCNFEVRYR